LTINGDASGSATFTNLGNATLTLTIADDSHNHVISNVDGLQDALDSKVDVVVGKGLSTEDYTSAEKSKLAGIEEGAQVNTVDSVAGKTGAVTLVKSDVGLGNVDNTSDLNKPISTATQTALGLKAPLASPALTGTPTAPTATAGTNTTQVATTAFVQTAVSGLVDSAPATLDTLNELAAALGDDPNFATTVSTQIGAKLDASAYTAADVLTKIKTVDGASSGLDADLLDGQQGSYYLDWTNVTNKPDPTLTLSGDVSGSATFTDLGNATLSVTVADDSHNHVISNVDGLQAALDSKAPLTGGGTSGTWPISVTGNAATVTNGVYTTGNQTVFGVKSFRTDGAGELNQLRIVNNTTAAVVQSAITLGYGSNFYGFRVVNVNNPSSTAAGDFKIQRGQVSSWADSLVISNSNNITITGDIRSPIFYDSNDTSYYINPNGTSNIDVLNNFSLVSGANECGIRYRVNSSAGDFSGRYSNYVALYNGISEAEIKIFDSSYINFNAYGLNSESWRAPIFYDSNNTAYYTDPASTSNLVGLTVANTISGSITGNAGTATNLSNTQSNWNSVGGLGNVVGMLAWKNYGNNHVIFDASQSTTPSGTSCNNTNSEVVWGGSYPTLMGWNGSNTYGVRVDSARVSDNTSGNSATTSQRTFSGDLVGSSSVRGPIFYDTDNTAYYVDPAGNGTRSAYLNGNLWINPKSESYGEGIAFNMPNQNTWGGIRWVRSGAGTNWAFGYFGNESSNDIGFHNGTNGWRLDHSFNCTTNGSFRAPIFYESNDTTYYVDPASTGQAAVRVRGGTLHGPNTTWSAYLLVGGNGREGYIDNTTTASVCTTNGNLHLDAASGYTTFINYYDGSSVNFGNGSGTTVITFDSSGNGTFNGSVSSPIFYDSNNTAYYCDPASTSRLHTLIVENNTPSDSRLELKSTSTSGYTTIRAFYAGTEQHQIHFFGSTWGTNFTNQSRGAINLSGNGGVTFGAWNSPAGYVDNSGNAGFRGNVTAYAYSDIRLKHNIKPISDAPLSLLKELSGVRYDWDDSFVTRMHGDEDERWCKKHDIGVIAHEVQKVLPEAVVTQDDGYLAVRYEKIIPLLIEAIKEQQGHIEALQKRIEHLEGTDNGSIKETNYV
jgi:hypothetical protein